MEKHIAYVVAISVVLLTWAACDRDHTVEANKSTSNLEYLSFTDHGCQGHGALGKATSSTPFLSKSRLSGDTLTLSIVYSANCCPGFVDSVSIHDTTVDICIDDTLNGCRCMCEYENDFTIKDPYSFGTLRVRFGWMGQPFELDTLIHLP